jgi:hypothetical protein
MPVRDTVHTVLVLDQRQPFEHLVLSTESNWMALGPWWLARGSEGLL